MGLNRPKGPKWKRFPRHYFAGQNGQKFKRLHTLGGYLVRRAEPRSRG